MHLQSMMYYNYYYTSKKGPMFSVTFVDNTDGVETKVETKITGEAAQQVYDLLYTQARVDLQTRFPEKVFEADAPKPEPVS